MNLVINLSIPNANLIIQALGKLPHDDVAPLIGDIKQQAIAQIEQAQRQAQAEAEAPNPEPEEAQG